MSNVDDDNRLKSLKHGKNRWTRVREAYQSGELDRTNVLLQSKRKRMRRNALANISNVSNQKQEFSQLVERIRELQNEIVPDVFLYPIVSSYSPFSSLPSSSSTSRGSISLYPNRRSISISTSSLNSLLPNQRFALSPKMIERAHQIPERFWLDWQQKQMQDQIEELEYIKNNMIDSSISSLPTNETDENDIDTMTRDRRKSLLFLYEAQRLANERRASLARAMTTDELTLKEKDCCARLVRAATIDESITKLKENQSNFNQHHTFNFDQRSEETSDAANLDDFKESPSNELAIPRSPIQHSPSSSNRSRTITSLPFTNLDTREQIRLSHTNDSISRKALEEKTIETNDITTQTISLSNEIDNRMQINSESQIETHPKSFRPLFYSKGTINRKIKFQKFQPLSPRITTMTMNEDIPIQITIFKRKEIDHSESSSPTFSFKSARSHLSPINITNELDDDI